MGVLKGPRRIIKTKVRKMKDLLNLEGVVALRKGQLKGINGGSQSGWCGECYVDAPHKCIPGIITSQGCSAC